MKVLARFREARTRPVTILLRSRRLAEVRTRFNADLWFAKIHSLPTRIEIIVLIVRILSMS